MFRDILLETELPTLVGVMLDFESVRNFMGTQTTGNF